MDGESSASHAGEGDVTSKRGKGRRKGKEGSGAEGLVSLGQRGPDQALVVRWLRRIIMMPANKAEMLTSLYMYMHLSHQSKSRKQPGQARQHTTAGSMLIIASLQAEYASLHTK